MDTSVFTLDVMKELGLTKESGELETFSIPVKYIR